VDGGPYCIPHPADLGIKDERKRLHDIRADTGCTFYISDTRPDDRRLVSIVGKREKLGQAAARVTETW
jgi:hypothetical protein